MVQPLKQVFLQFFAKLLVTCILVVILWCTVHGTLVLTLDGGACWFSLDLGLRKTILAASAYTTPADDGSSHEHACDVQEVSVRTFTPASTANKTAETWEHVTPRPAIHQQCAHIILPPSVMATQHASGVLLRRWECISCFKELEKKNWKWLQILQTFPFLHSESQQSYFVGIVF